MDATSWWTVFGATMALATAYFVGEVRVLTVKLKLTAADRDKWEAEARRREAELRVAIDRLIASWKDGYTVPDAGEVVDGDVPAPMPPMSVEEQEFLQQWEGPARAYWERFMLARKAAGRTTAQALADAEATLVNGQENLLQPQLAPATPY